MSPMQRILLPLTGLIALCAVAAAAQSAAPATPREPQVRKWTVAGLERQALVFPPAKALAGAKVPLLFVFHGHGGNAHGTAQLMRFEEYWPEAVVVYMQGLLTPSRIDPHAAHPGWQHEIGELGDRDLNFFDAALASLRAEYPVDARRVYAAGFSNGAFFNYLLWAARPGVIAAFAPASGKIWPTLHLGEPRSLFAVMGQRDLLVPLRDAMASAEEARRLAGLKSSGEPCGPGCLVNTSLKGIAVMTLVHSGGHAYPPTVTPKIVEFFKAHPAP